MGGTSWLYTAPYQPDVEQALQQTRRRLYREAFARNAPSAHAELAVERASPGAVQALLDAMEDVSFSERELLPARDEVLRAAQSPVPDFLKLLRRVSKLALDASGLERHAERISRAAQSSTVTPGSAATDEEDIDSAIQALLEERETEGTGTLLDILHTADRPDFACLSPAPPELLRRVFGTERPARSAVEAAGLVLAEECERGSGHWFVAFEDNAPHSLVFVGASGD